MSRWRAFWERGGFWRALLLVAIYLAFYLGAGRLIGAIAGDGFEDPLSSATSVFVNLVAPIVVGIALLAVFGASLGWLRGLFARQPIGGSWWMWILPAVILGYNVLRFAAADYSHFSAATVPRSPAPRTSP
jgi:CAAX protease family protein